MPAFFNIAISSATSAELAPFIEIFIDASFTCFFMLVSFSATCTPRSLASAFASGAPLCCVLALGAPIIFAPLLFFMNISKACGCPYPLITVPSVCGI